MTGAHNQRHVAHAEFALGEGTHDLKTRGVGEDLERVGDERELFLAAEGPPRRRDIGGPDRLKVRGLGVASVFGNV